jgi:hypothetical protein
MHLFVITINLDFLKCDSRSDRRSWIVYLIIMFRLMINETKNDKSEAMMVVL